ncbi:MAG: hypothetical protein Rhirs2KO_10850 [Rhizobiaceae bacterium]
MVVNVPRDLQEALGKSKLKQVLPTDSLTTANQLKWPIVHSFKTLIARHRSPEGVKAEAVRLAELRRKSAAADDGTGLQELHEYILDRSEELGGSPVDTDDQGRAVYAPERERIALEFRDIALGKRTPMELWRATYLDQINVKPRTRDDDQRAFAALMSWCQKNNVAPLLETFGRNEAARFTDDFRKSEGRGPVTLNKYIRRLGLYWKWLERRDAVDRNVWAGLIYTVPLETQEVKERPFTDAEVATLLAGTADPKLHDLMCIAALSGARIDVIVSLSVGDCINGTFRFKPQKREPSARLVPIHSGLIEIVERRTRGKLPEDHLFPEWPPVKKVGSRRERSFKASNQFTEYRRSVGVDHRIDGKRRSLVNFHSFRRWFVMKAEHAGQPLETIQSVIGHKREPLAFDVYNRFGASVEQMTRCVEAVKLPELTLQAA